MNSDKGSKSDFFRGGGGCWWGEGGGGVSEQMFLTALLPLKENTCAKLF